MKELVLASRSPRRKEILSLCGAPFICDPADVDETIDCSKPLADEIERLSVKKGETVLKRHPDAVVIGSDTMVVIDNKPLGKPHTNEAAFAMLKSLQGRTHHVLTGLCIVSQEECYRTAVSTAVHFLPMNDDEIHAYIATGECSDKAGAYAIQGYGGRYIEGIEGDYYAVMGLPLHLVYAELKRRQII
ncbi:MAG: Maf family protein [Lactimicrobium massiliense]|nr:Maf family protein [Lactimicrobium massiliense]MDD6726924.1 Maf family protein [Lactimicrobium massiliense]